MRRASARSGPAILAAAATGALGLTCLLAADLDPTRAIGPAAAVAVLASDREAIQTLDTSAPEDAQPAPAAGPE